MFQATRRRLALWYTAVTAVLLLLFATGFYLYVRNTLIERVDDTLNHVVEVVVRSLVITKNDSNPQGTKLRVNIEASFRDNADTVEDDHIDLEWFSSTGELLWSTLSESLNIPIHANRTGETVRVLRDDSLNRSHSLLLRQVTERVQIGRQVMGYLRVSHPWFEVTKPIHQLVIDLSLGTAGMVISVAAIGWLLSGLAIEPVRESYQRLKQFTADASHELRSPIAMIQTNVQVALADSEPIPPLHRQQLQVVERLTRRLGRLVDDLLFLARQDSGIVQPSFALVPLDALLMDVIEEQQLLAASKLITLSLNIISPLADNNGVQEGDCFVPRNDAEEGDCNVSRNDAKEGDCNVSRNDAKEGDCNVSRNDVKEGDCFVPRNDAKEGDCFVPRNDAEEGDCFVPRNDAEEGDCFVPRNDAKVPSNDAEEVFTLQGDWDQLARLFTNLVTNAVQYTKTPDVAHQKASVRVELQRIGRSNHYYLQVKVIDTGIGIPEDALPKLFDRFYRVDLSRSHNSTSGTGLGLAIAAAIVQNHQGHIQIASSLNLGTTVTITLPSL